MGSQALPLQSLLTTCAAAVVLQTVPQAPQLLPSIELSASQPLNLLLSQVRYEPEHMGAHWLLTHRLELTCAVPLVEQTMPQPPQLPGLLVVLVSQPSVAPPVQSPNPLLQTGAVQAVAEQVEVAFGYLVLQSLPAAPQPPQFLVLVPMLISQPFFASPSQSRKLPLQLLTEQAPRSHLGVPLSMVQGWPQPPQAPVSVLVLVSQPSA